MLVGCGKHDQPAPQSAVPTSTVDTNSNANAEASPAPVGDAPVVPTDSGEAKPQASGPPNLEQLTHELHQWIGKKQRLPKNFEEFAADNASRIPPPPEGKKYAINSKWRVVLVDR